MNFGSLLQGGVNGALIAALMSQRNTPQPGASPMAQQQGFQMPTVPGTQFSMPAQAPAQYGQNGPSYQNALAQALMMYGGGNGGQ